MTTTTTTANDHPRSPPHPSNGRRSILVTSRQQRPSQLARKQPPQGILKNSSNACKDHDRKQDEEGMAASFLQFCATCERQILVPNNQMLYCSESCRKKDNHKTPAYSTLQPETPLRVSPFVTMDVEHHSHRDIIPKASPRTRSTDFTTMLPPLDTSAGRRQKPAKHSPKSSDAHDYLLKFHRAISTPNSSISPTAGYSVPYSTQFPTTSPYRAPFTHSRTASTNSTTTPSLTHSSSASSSPTSLDYNFSTRPLPPRHDPQSYSASSRSIELVTPHLSTAYSVPSTLNSTVLDTGTKRLTNGELLYEKRWTLPSVESRRGSLQQLLEGQDSDTTHVGG